MDDPKDYSAPWLHLEYEQCLTFYRKQIEDAQKEGISCVRAMIRYMGERDLFFLLVEVLNRADLYHPFFFARCREVQANPDGHLDLWAREHGKSSIITFGMSFLEIIRDSEITIGIFSHTRPIAKAFLRQIMQEMQRNEKLFKLWPEIFWRNPRTESPKWSEDEGIVVKRQGNPKEATIEAWGLVDGQPTSKHYKLRVYDDVVTRESVSTPDQIQKTTEAWELSINLGTADGRERYIGTRYHLYDTYHAMIKRGSVIARVYPATDDGTDTGKPVLLTQERLNKLRKDQGLYTFASQMLQNPNANNAQGFLPEWIQFADVTMAQAKSVMNIYLICDPASGKNIAKRKDPDYTTMWVIGVGPDQNYYVLDGVRDRLNLTARTKHFIRLHRLWRPHASGYEEYGMQADIEHIETQQTIETYRFSITPLGGRLSKPDRIKGLIPKFEGKNIYLPRSLNFLTSTGEMVDLIKVFVEEEYSAFPVLQHDDMLDCMARILDPALGVIFPDPVQVVEHQGYNYHDLSQGSQSDSDWAVY